MQESCTHGRRAIDAATRPYPVLCSRRSPLTGDIWRTTKTRSHALGCPPIRKQDVCDSWFGDAADL
jgi:hypothetical protein